MDQRSMSLHTVSIQISWHVIFVTFVRESAQVGEDIWKGKLSMCIAVMDPGEAIAMELISWAQAFHSENMDLLKSDEGASTLIHKYICTC